MGEETFKTTKLLWIQIFVVLVGYWTKYAYVWTQLYARNFKTCFFLYNSVYHIIAEFLIEINLVLLCI